MIQAIFEESGHPSSLSHWVRGRSVCVVDAINPDIPSGGRTATAALLERLNTASSVRTVQLSAGAGAWWRRMGFLVSNGPGTLALAVYRSRPRWVWLEFLTRASPVFAFYVWLVLRKERPDIVVFNHHATFLFSTLCSRSTQRLFVWHDLPSAKLVLDNDGSHLAEATQVLERALAQRCMVAATFSIEERQRLQQLYGFPVLLAPAVTMAAAAKAATRTDPGMLLVGGWSRPENAEGADLFFREYLAATTEAEAAKLSFRVAGHGAHEFVKQLRARLPASGRLQLVVSSSYACLADFPEKALLAPILRGAGIKLKTLEAWAAGLPVIGTPQAFSGVSARAAAAGGLAFPNVRAMAQWCARTTAALEACDQMDGRRAWAAYAAEVHVDEGEAT